MNGCQSRVLAILRMFGEIAARSGRRARLLTAAYSDRAGRLNGFLILVIRRFRILLSGNTTNHPTGLQWSPFSNPKWHAMNVMEMPYLGTEGEVCPPPPPGRPDCMLY